jgi:hypothetical protein
MSYITVDQIARAALKLGRGTLIAKIDIKSAYRLIPVHPSDRIWQGLMWEDHINMDGCYHLGYVQPQKYSTPLQINWSGVYPRKGWNSYSTT